MGVRRAWLGIVVAGAVLACPSTAGAAITWSAAPQTVSVGGQNAGPVSAAVDAQGNTLAAWTQISGGTTRVATAYRPAGGFFEPPVFRSAAGSNAGDPDVAFAPDGTAIVAWHRAVVTSPSVQNQIETIVRQTNGTFEGLQVLSNNAAQPTGETATDPQVAIDGSGIVLVAYKTQDLLSATTRSTGKVRARFRAPNGALGTLSTIYTAGTPNTATGRINQLRVALDTAGNALVGIASTADTEFDTSSRLIHTVQRVADGAWETGGRLQEDGGRDGIVSLDDIDLRAGNAFVVWRVVSVAGEEQTAVNFRAAGGGTTTWGIAQRFGGSSQAGVDDAQLVTDAGGNAVLVATRTNTVTEDGRRRVVSAYRPTGGTFGALAPVAVAPVGVLLDDLGIDADGTVTALWSTVSGTARRQVQASTRTPGPAGTFDAPQPVSADADLRTPGTLALGAPGNAVALWGQSDGSNVRLHAGFGSPPPPPPPPGEPPVTVVPVPPPPPPPEPPVPSAIQAARPIVAGKATVLTVAVTGQVSTVRWTFTGGGVQVSGPPIIGRTVSGVLQRSVRVRSDGPFTATVQASGPGGSTTVARSFAGAQDPADAEAKRILGGQDLAGRIAAVGDASTLLGQGSACGQVTIFSGVRALSGCLRPIDSLEDIRPAERGVLEPLAKSLNIPSTDTALMRRAVELTEGYVSTGPLELNSGWTVTPPGGGRVLTFPQAKAVVSPDAGIRVGGTLIRTAGGGFNLPLDPKTLTIELGTVPRPAALSEVGDFALVGDIDVTLFPTTAALEATMRLPSFVSRNGNAIQVPVKLRATPGSRIAEPVTYGPKNVRFGILPVDDFKITYDPGADEWRGSGSACPFDVTCFDLVQPRGGIRIKNGSLASALANVDYGSPGKILSPGVFLENIGVGFGLDPSRLLGNARLGVGQLLKIDGRIVLVYPSGATPYVPRREDIGPNLPGKFYSQRFTNPAVLASADAILALPIIGETRLGGGYLIYEAPGYAAFGGSASLDLLGILRFSGGVDGEYDLTKGLYNLHGDIRACLTAVRGICGASVTNISRGPNLAGGAGSCVQIGPVSVGGGVQWATGKTTLWPLDGCKWSPFAVKVRTRQAGGVGATTVEVRAGGPSQAVQLTGVGGAPMVRVTGPGGQSLDSTVDQGMDMTPGGRIRILRFDSEQAKLTVVGLQDAQPGTYRIEPLPGSVPVSAVSGASDPEDAQITGKLTGDDRRRVLTYRLRARPNQTVTFYEIAAGGTARAIGTSGGRTSGTVAFAPTPGRGSRAIVARFALNGIPAEEKTLARYVPPSPTLGTPAGLRVTRGAGRLTLRWLPVPGATAYEVTVTTSDGSQRFATTRGRTTTVSGVAKSVSGRATVRAVDALRSGKTASATFKRTAAKAGGALKPLRKCTVGKKRVTCRN